MNELDPTIASSDSAADHPPAGFWLRVLARLVDMVALNLVAALTCLATALLHIAGLSGIAAVMFLVAGGLFLQFFYFAFFTSRGRQTFGYRCAGLRVETQEQQQPLSIGRASARAAINLLSSYLLAIYIGLVDYLMVAFHRRKRALHDVLTGTQVVRIAPLKPALIALSAVVLCLFFAGMRLSDGQLLGVRAFYIPSGAMENTLRINDRILVNTLYYRLKEPRFQDVIIFRAPSASGSGGQDFIKRCVGVPGEIIEVRNRQLYRNGKAAPESYAKWSGPPEAPIYSYDMKIVDGKVYSREYLGPNEPHQWVQAPRIFVPNQARIDRAKPEAVPPGQLLMLGDHRNNSNDSHAWGFVPRANLIGRAMNIHWPLDRLGGL